MTGNRPNGTGPRDPGPPQQTPGSPGRPNQQGPEHNTASPAGRAEETMQQTDTTPQPPMDQYGMQLIEHMLNLSANLHPGVIIVAAQSASRTITLVARSDPQHTSREQLVLLSTTHAERAKKVLSLLDNPQDQLDLRLTALTISVPAILQQAALASIPTAAIAAVTQAALPQPLDPHLLTPVVAGVAAALAWTALRTVQWSIQGRAAAREIISRLNTFRPTASPPPDPVQSVAKPGDTVLMVQTYPDQEDTSQPNSPA